MRLKCTRLFCITLAAAALSLVQAQAKPNFSGSWKLNVSKSDFGPLPAPDSRTDQIKQNDPDIADNTTQSGQMGEMSAEIKYSTDGKETTYQIRGVDFKSTAKWDGDELLINTKGSFGGNDITTTDRWSLSADGKTITINRHAVSPMGEADMKVILEKQ